MPKVLALLLLLNLSAFTQTTWRGLHFGMSEPQARKVYEGTLRQAYPADVSGAFTLIDDNQKLEGMPARASLHFNGAKTLRGISLVVKDPFANETEISAAGSSLATIDVLNDDLIEKYEKPTIKEGECALTARMISLNQRSPFSCKMMWKSEGQIIKLDWYFHDGRLSALFLTYTLPPKDIWL